MSVLLKNKILDVQTTCDCRRESFERKQPPRLQSHAASAPRRLNATDTLKEPYLKQCIVYFSISFGVYYTCIFLVYFSPNTSQKNFKKCVQLYLLLIFELSLLVYKILDTNKILEIQKWVHHNKKQLLYKFQSHYICIL